MTPPIQLLVIDIDGTLLDPHFQITARNMAALQAAHRAGVHVILATGRRHDFALPIAQMLGFDTWLISSNGALTKSSRGERFHCDLLPRSTALRLCETMGPFRANMCITFDRDGKGALVIEEFEQLNTSIGRWMEKNAAFIERVIPIEDALVEDPIQAMYCGTVAHMKAAEDRLAASGLAGDITVLRTQYDARNLTIVDVLNRDCSKGHAVRRWAESRGIPRHAIMAIGDNYNDVEMLEYAGIPVVMGNASDDLKSRGWTLTLSNDQSGVGAAIEQVLGTRFEEPAGVS